MLKVMNNFGVRVFQVAWKTGEVPKQWQTSMLIPIQKKGDKKKCTNYRGIPLLSLPLKVYAKCFEKRSRMIAKPQLQDARCGIRPGKSTIDQIFVFKQVFEKSWKYAKEYTCFVPLEKAYEPCFKRQDKSNTAGV